MIVKDFIYKITTGGLTKNDILAYAKGCEDVADLSFEIMLEIIRVKSNGDRVIGVDDNNISRLAKEFYLYNGENFENVLKRLIKAKEWVESIKLHQRTTQNKKNDAIFTDRAQKYFERAIEAGFMEQTNSGYNWVWGGTRGGKARLAYFLYNIYNPDGCQSIQYKALQELFNRTRLDTAVDQAINTKKPQKWRAEIDNRIFFD